MFPVVFRPESWCGGGVRAIQGPQAGGATATATPLCSDGATPLYAAAMCNENPAVVEALLAAGADIDARNSFGATPLHGAAVSNESPAVIEALLAAGARLDARTIWGATPLHGAAENSGRGPAIETLVAAGARLNVRDEDDNTPLHIAARFADADDSSLHAGDALEALLNAGADPKARNAFGETPWDLARGNEALRRSNAYWRLNELRFDDPVGR